MKYPEIEIADIANFINGFAFKPDDWGNEGLPIIRIQNLSDPAKDFNRTKRSVPERYRVQRGDILVSWSATIDVFEWDDEDSLLNQHIFKVVFDSSKVVKQYFKLALKKTINDLIKFAHGSTMKHVVKKDFEKHKIPLPPLDDQTRIATLLSRVEALIATRKDNLRLLDEFLKSTFLEMFGEPVRNEKGWEKKTAIDYADCIVPGRDKPKSFTGETPWVNTDDMICLGFTGKSKKGFGLSDEEINEVCARVVPKGSVVITCVGDLGIVTICSKEMVVNQQLHTFQMKDGMNNIFFMYSISFQKNFMYRHATKTTVPYMNKTICNSIPIINPPIKLQNQFASIVEKAESLKTLYQQSLSELENLYGILSQKAFKGELDLSRIPLEKAAEEMLAATTTEPAGQIAKPDGHAMSDPAAREQLLRQLFDAFIAEQKGKSFSLGGFWTQAEQQVVAHMDDESPPLGVTDYDKVKTWLFDLLKNGQANQHFYEGNNYIGLSIRG